MDTNCKSIEQYLHSQIPMSQAMQVSVDAAKFRGEYVALQHY